MKEVNDRWIRISGISMLLLLDLYSYQIFVKPFGLDTLKYFIEFLLLTSTTWEANRWIIGRFRQ